MTTTTTRRPTGMTLATNRAASKKDASSSPPPNPTTKIKTMEKVKKLIVQKWESLSSSLGSIFAASTAVIAAFRDNDQTRMSFLRTIPFRMSSLIGGVVAFVSRSILGFTVNAILTSVSALTTLATNLGIITCLLILFGRNQKNKPDKERKTYVWKDGANQLTSEKDGGGVKKERDSENDDFVDDDYGDDDNGEDDAKYKDGKQMSKAERTYEARQVVGERPRFRAIREGGDVDGLRIDRGRGSLIAKGVVGSGVLGEGKVGSNEIGGGLVGIGEISGGVFGDIVSGVTEDGKVAIGEAFSCHQQIFSRISRQFNSDKFLDKLLNNEVREGNRRRLRGGGGEGVEGEGGAEVRDVEEEERGREIKGGGGEEVGGEEIGGKEEGRGRGEVGCGGRGGGEGGKGIDVTKPETLSTEKRKRGGGEGGESKERRKKEIEDEYALALRNRPGCNAPGIRKRIQEGEEEQGEKEKEEEQREETVYLGDAGDDLGGDTSVSEIHEEDDEEDSISLSLNELIRRVGEEGMEEEQMEKGGVVLPRNHNCLRNKMTLISHDAGSKVLD